MEALFDTAVSSPRRVAVPVLIRNGRPCHQQRFCLASSTSSAAASSQHIHGQSTIRNNNSSAEGSLPYKNDTSPIMLFNDRHHIKYDNIDLFSHLNLLQWVLPQKSFLPKT